jgi:hypothetical protein
LNSPFLDRRRLINVALGLRDGGLHQGYSGSSDPTGGYNGSGLITAEAATAPDPNPGPFAGGYVPSFGESLGSQFGHNALSDTTHADLPIGNFPVASDGNARTITDSNGKIIGYSFEGTAFVHDPATGAFANLTGSPGSPTIATVDENGALRIERRRSRR